MNKKLEVALKLAQCGFSIFPVQEKVPAIENYGDNATTDEEIIKEWFDEDEYYDLSIGVLLSDGEYQIVDPSVPYLKGTVSGNIKKLKKNRFVYRFIKYNLETHLLENGGFIFFVRLLRDEKDYQISDQVTVYIEKADPKAFLNHLIMLNKEDVRRKFIFKVDFINGICFIQVEFVSANSDKELIYYNGSEIAKNIGTDDLVSFNYQAKERFIINFSNPMFNSAFYTLEEISEQYNSIQNILNRGKGRLLEVRSNSCQLLNMDLDSSKSSRLIKFDQLELDAVIRSVIDFFGKDSEYDLNVDLGDDFILIFSERVSENYYKVFGDTLLYKRLLITPPEKFLEQLMIEIPDEIYV